MAKNRAFLITIDTEGDNLWAISDIHRKIETRNADYLFRFQELCEKYGFVPTYLTNYEMANEPALIELGREGIKKGTLEIGAHEHAWNTPPYFPLIRKPGKRGKPYLSEYPRSVIRNKLKYMTQTLEDTFQCPVTSHRGGRWCLNEIIAVELSRLGYLVDCTCTPGIDWSKNPGWSIGSKGTDWSHSSSREFYIDSWKKKAHDTTGLMEVPVSIFDMKKSGHYSWLRPTLRNSREMMCLLDFISQNEYGFAEFMLHSSELMPGGSPTFTNKGKIERLYDDIEGLFSHAASSGYVGMGISQYARLIDISH